MGNSSSNVSNVTETQCDADGNCERVVTSCVDGDCKETRTPIEADETVEGGDDEVDGEDDETVEEDDEGDKKLDIDEVYEIETETKVKEKSFPIGMIIFLILLVVLFFVVVLIFLFKKKSNVPKIPKISKTSKIPKNLKSLKI